MSFTTIRSAPETNPPSAETVWNFGWKRQATVSLRTGEMCADKGKKLKICTEPAYSVEIMENPEISLYI
jgi:hypothetical protein